MKNEEQKVKNLLPFGLIVEHALDGKVVSNGQKQGFQWSEARLLMGGNAGAQEL